MKCSMWSWSWCVVVAVCGVSLLAGLAPAAQAQLPGKVTVGERIPSPLETAHPHAKAEGGQPALVWSETLHHPAATYIAVHFRRFELAPGDWVVVRAPDGTESRRYEGLGRAGLGRSAEGFWAVHVKGDTAVVELWSDGGAPGWGLAIDHFARGLTQQEIYAANPGMDEPEPGLEAICGTNDSEWAVCFENDEPEIYEAAQATIRLMINGLSACTGWLVGCDGHVMTNNHCIGSQSSASNTDFEFLAEGATCSTSCASWGACPGIVEADTGTLIRTNVGLDYTLVQLPVNVTETYGFLKLREEGPVVDERIYIPQHPAAWGKQVAVHSGSSQDESGFCEVFSLNQPACTGGPGDVGYYCDTQGGSSGSPVLAYSDHRVVALHHCANCPNRGLNIADVIDDLGDDLPACSTQQLAGVLELSRDVSTCNEVLSVSVRDDSLAGAGTMQVAYWSDSEPTSDGLTLTEQSSGLFVGSLALDTVPTASGDGVLTVSHDDTAVVEYVDADDGQGGVDVPHQASVQVDCVAPAISNVQATQVTGTAAMVTWQTDEPATSTVVYGVLPPGSGSADEDELVTQHGVALGGLEECTTHFFTVVSSDEAGNVAADDNQGLSFDFATGIDSNAQLAATGLPTSIPDNDYDGATSSIGVADDREIVDADVGVSIHHNFVGDLTLSLRPPVGNPVILSKFHGGSGNDYTNTVFDDEAATAIAAGSPPFLGSFAPDFPLSQVDGLTASGTWTLEVVDAASGTTGTIDAWNLLLTYPPEACPPVAAGPPAVGDGANGGEPLRASRLDEAGTELSLSWEPGCASADTKVIWGPLDQVSSWSVGGAACSTTTPMTWSSAPGGSIWFLAVHETDGVEGSWGSATAGERHGIAPSGQCGATDKDPLSAACP